MERRGFANTAKKLIFSGLPIRKLLSMDGGFMLAELDLPKLFPWCVAFEIK